MRYYPNESIDLRDMKRKLNDYSCNEESDKILLTQYGMFKYVKNVLMVSKFNLMESSSCISNLKVIKLLSFVFKKLKNFLLKIVIRTNDFL